MGNFEVDLGERLLELRLSDMDTQGVHASEQQVNAWLHSLTPPQNFESTSSVQTSYSGKWWKV